MHFTFGETWIIEYMIRKIAVDEHYFCLKTLSGTFKKITEISHNLHFQGHVTF